MLNIAIGHGMGARKAGRYRVGAARPTNGVVVRPGVAAGVAAAGVVVGAVAGTPWVDARLVTRDRVEIALPTDGEGEAGRKLTWSKTRRGGLRSSAHDTRSIDSRPLSAATARSVEDKCGSSKLERQ